MEVGAALQFAWSDASGSGLEGTKGLKDGSDLEDACAGKARQITEGDLTSRVKLASEKWRG